MNQLELHKKIEEFFKAAPATADVSYANSLLVNDDAKRFFFNQANEFWLDWLWQNGFLNGLKQKATDATKYTYQLPELEYLTRMTEKQAAKVTEILLDRDNATSEQNFNPEVVDRFFRIIGSLPAENIKALTVKIRDEKWFFLMRNYRESGYAFERIVKKLVDSKESQGLLEFVQALLTVKSKDEISERENMFSFEEPFYLTDTGASDIFEALAQIEGPYAEEALKISTGIMSQIVRLGKPDEDKIFDYNDLFALLDVDMFTLEIEDKRSTSYKIDVKNLTAVIKKLVERTIGKKCGDTPAVSRLFEYINSIPTCRSMWRLRLFVLTQCPNTFKEALKKAFFKVFEVGDRYFEIEGGAEYHQTLIRCFNVLDEPTQRDYVKKVFEYFGAKLGDGDKEIWRKRDGLKILILIKSYLTPDEVNLAQEVFGVSPMKEDFTPQPTVGASRSWFYPPYFAHRSCGLYH